MEDTEDTEYVASEHDWLVSAISKLDKTQHITEPTRNEPTNLNSEFNLIKKSNKLNLNNVAKILENTSNHVQISKKLKKTHDESKVLSKPLEKPQAERVKRATGYEETKKKVGRWDPVVARNRTVDYVSFPLKYVNTKLQPTGEFLSKFTTKSELEKQLDEIDPPALEEVDEEEEKIFPMSYEEMVEHRQHVAKLRAQQSYKAAKAKRQSKIKSKKFHRVLKKEKLKQQLKEFEELQKKDPEEALKKLESIEKGRALERHTLRHKNTGKWAKNKLIRAKYDKEVRQQLAEQLAVSRSLTQKIENNQSSDDEEDESEIIPDLNLAQDPLNPWVLQRSDKTSASTKFDQNKEKQKPEETDNLEYLKLKPITVKAVIDEELNETSSKNIEDADNEPESNSLTKIINYVQHPDLQNKDADIDPTRFIEVKPKYLSSAISQVENEYDQLDDEDEDVRKVNIEEVFEEDDVVASFRQEKEDERNKDKPEDINLTLPGWGSWGGKGVKPQKRKKNRFILNAAPKMPRRDENKGDIIIKEYKDPKLSVHKVKDVPFPFESVKDYEASIRAPLGNTFIPEKAHKKLIRPSVITKAGTIIEPMDEEELLVKKNRNFKNGAVLKMLGQRK